jgi:hypothetical protein
MEQMGLSRLAYWLSWFISFGVMNTICILALIAFGCLLGLEFFLENAFGTYFFLLWTTEFAFTCMGFFFSTLIQKAEAARSVGLLWYILTFIAAPVCVAILFYSDDPDYILYRDILAVFIPTLPYFKGLNDLIFWSSGNSANGLAWDDRGSQVGSSWDPNIESGYTLTRGWGDLMICSSILIVLTWYLDNGKRTHTFLNSRSHNCKTIVTAAD